MIITFSGHSTLHYTDELLKKIENAIQNNTDEKEKIIFYCGGMGDFDRACAKACLKIKEKRSNCELLLVTPYINFKNLDNSIYDGTIYPPLENVPLKFAIVKRNQWMIKNADFLIAYVNHSYGGAYNCLKYAQKLNKRIINLADALEK